MRGKERERGGEGGGRSYAGRVYRRADRKPKGQTQINLK